MLLDVDTEIQSDAPALLFEYMQQHPEAALIATHTDTRRQGRRHSATYRL